MMNSNDDDDDATDSNAELKARMTQLTEEHRDLDMAIAALMAQGGYDQLQVQRLKKRKLQLRDQITKLNDMLLPDIIA
jgi:hypothetical protein